MRRGYLEKPARRIASSKLLSHEGKKGYGSQPTPKVDSCTIWRYLEDIGNTFY
jgi:hypothetical protein